MLDYSVLSFLPYPISCLLSSRSFYSFLSSLSIMEAVLQDPQCADSRIQTLPLMHGRIYIQTYVLKPIFAIHV